MCLRTSNSFRTYFELIPNSVPCVYALRIYFELISNLFRTPGSWEPRAGSWELGLGVGKWAELGRVGFSNEMKMVGELNIVIWEIDHLYNSGGAKYSWSKVKRLGPKLIN